MIENDLRARGRYTFIPLAVDTPADWKQSMSAGIISAVSAWFPRDLRAFLKQAAEENRLDVIVSVSSFDTGRWPRRPQPRSTKGSRRPVGGHVRHSET